MHPDLTDLLDAPLVGASPPRPAPASDLTDLLAGQEVPILRVPAPTRSRVGRVSQLRETAAEAEAEREFLELLEAAAEALVALLAIYRRRAAVRGALGND
jgi:hypothetical protein